MQLCRKRYRKYLVGLWPRGCNAHKRQTLEEQGDCSEENSNYVFAIFIRIRVHELRRR